MDMSANYIDLTDDSDEIPLRERIAARNNQTPKPAPAPLEDPDWVRSFTPIRAPSPKASDSDSLINLLSDEDQLPTQEGGTQDILSTQEVLSTQEEGEKKVQKRARSTKKPPKSELSLVAASKLDEGLALLQADGAELDLSGDVGAVGRVKVDDDECILDIKGTLYSALPYHCNTAAVVSIMDDEARIGAVLNEAIVLNKCDNVFASDNGVLDGHTFDADMNGDETKQEAKKEEDIEEAKNGATKKGKKNPVTPNGSSRKGGKKQSKLNLKPKPRK